MLKTRIITAIIMLGVFIPALFFMPLMWWAVSMLVFSLLALNEWAGLLQLNQTTKNVYLIVAGLLGASALYGLAEAGFHFLFYQGLILFFIVTIFWLLCVPVWLFFTTKVPVESINMLLGMLLIGSLWLALVCAKEVNPVFLLVIISTIWLADSAAYFAGKRYGRHKLAPNISPGKTWEGVAGALFAVSVYGALLCVLGDVNTWWVLPCLWLVTIAGVYGDLLESLYKRRANLKDSGQILPGHGGLLDRIDGVIPALPIGLLLVYSFHYFNSAYSF